MAYGKIIYGQYGYGEDGDSADIDVGGTYDVDLTKYLTSNYTEGKNIINLMKIAEDELGTLKFYCLTLGEQRSANKVTWGLPSWEKELGITYNPSASVTDRREIIKAKLRGRGTTTKKMIQNTAQAFSGGEVEIIEYPEEYYFVVRFIGIKGIPRNMQGFIDMLESIKPAHLGYEFKYTYTVWNNLNNLTWNQAGMKIWDELKVYEGE